VRGLRADDGLTLVELLVAAAITALIAPVLTSALVVGWKTTDATVSSLSDSRNRQLAPSLFTRDVQSAMSIATTGAGCLQPADTLLVRFGRTETSATGSTTSPVVTWVLTATGVLERRSCDSGAAITSSVTGAHDVVGTPTVACKNAAGASVACASAAVVDLSVTDPSGVFTATGRRRTS
jgi:type II secretory pathway component PulJ